MRAWDEVARLKAGRGLMAGPRLCITPVPQALCLSAVTPMLKCHPASILGVGLRLKAPFGAPMRPQLHCATHVALVLHALTARHAHVLCVCVCRTSTAPPRCSLTSSRASRTRARQSWTGSRRRCGVHVPSTCACAWEWIVCVHVQCSCAVFVHAMAQGMSGGSECARHACMQEHGSARAGADMQACLLWWGLRSPQPTRRSVQRAWAKLRSGRAETGRG